MHAPRNPLSVLSLAAASACLMFAGIGCKSDVEKADAAVNAAIAQGDTTARSPEELAAAAEKALAFKGASPAAQVTANMALASAKSSQAGELLADIDRKNNRIVQLVSEISRTVDVIQKNNALQLAYKKSEPTSAEAAVQKAKDAALGKSDPVWFKHDSGSIPAMSGVDKTIADTQAQIQTVEAEIKRLGDERTKAISEGERLGKDAEAASGRASLDLFTKAEAQRDVSRRDAAKVIQQQAKLKMLHEDLDRALAEKKVLATAVAGLDAQLKETQAGWTATEADIKQLHDLTVALLGSGSSASVPSSDGDATTKPADAPAADPAAPAEEKKEDDAGKPAARSSVYPGTVRLISSDVILAQLPASRGPTPAPGGRKAPKPASVDDSVGGAPASQPVLIDPVSVDISAKAAELKALAVEVQEERDKADALLASAADHYKTAATAAEGLTRTVSGLQSKFVDREKPEKMIWADLLEAYNPSSIGLQQASVQLMIARLHQSAAEEFGMRGKMVTVLQTALKEAGATAPGDLSAAPIDLNTKAVDEREKAAKAYVAADEFIGTVEKATSTNPAMTQASQLSRLLKIASYYGQGQLKGQTEPDKVEGFVTQAVNEAKSGGDALTGGSGGSLVLPVIIQDALGLRKGTGDLSGVSSTTTSGPSSNPTSEPTTSPTTGPADPSKVFENPADGSGGTAETKPSAKPAEGASGDSATPAETPAPEPGADK